MLGWWTLSIELSVVSVYMVINVMAFEDRQLELEGNMGPKTDPCGTPCSVGRRRGAFCLIFMTCVRCTRYDVNHASTV